MRRRAWMVGAAALAVTACLDLSTDPDEIVAIEFVPPAWPSVVAGDTLRDSTGAAAPLAARLFSGDGSEIMGAPVVFLPDDDRIRIEPGDYLVAEDTASGTARVRASTAGVQSIVRQVDVVPRPDSLAPDGTVTALEWVIPDVAATNTSGALGVRLLSITDDDTTDVRSWVVTFELESDGAIVAPGDTSGVFLVGDAGRQSSADTTDTNGRASRRVRVRISAGFTPPDSVIVTIRASHRGTALPGSPVRWVLPLRPR